MQSGPANQLLTFSCTSAQGTTAGTCPGLPTVDGDRCDGRVDGRRFDMQTMKKRVAQVLIGAVGLASVATAGVALAANGDRSPSPNTGKTPTVVSTDDRRGHDGRGENEPG